MGEALKSPTMASVFLPSVCVSRCELSVPLQHQPGYLLSRSPP